MITIQFPQMFTNKGLIATDQWVKGSILGRNTFFMEHGVFSLKTLERQIFVYWFVGQIKCVLTRFGK